MISGFLLYRPFALAHFSGGRPPAARGFWARRLKRIIPAYWVAFLVVTYVLHADQVGHDWYAPLVYLGFAQIYFPLLALGGLPQAWSLCTEMSFYLMVPLWAALIGRRRRDPATQLRAELLGLGILVAISFAWRTAVLSGHSMLEASMPNWLPAYLDQFALGMFLAVISAWCTVTDRRPGWLWHPAMPWVSWSLALGAFIAVSNIGLPLAPVTAAPVGVSLARQTLYGVFAFCMVAPAVFGPQDRGLVRRFLRLRWVAAAGVVSYGVYLWHEAWLHLYLRWTGNHLFTHPWSEMAAIVAALAIASASASYFLVERPILRWKRRKPLRSTAAAAPVPVPAPAAPAGAAQ